jgi:hypothetical protein
MVDQFVGRLAEGVAGKIHRRGLLSLPPAAIEGRP